MELSISEQVSHIVEQNQVILVELLVNTAAINPVIIAVEAVEVQSSQG